MQPPGPDGYSVTEVRITVRFPDGRSPISYRVDIQTGSFLLEAGIIGPSYIEISEEYISYSFARGFYVLGSPAPSVEIVNNPYPDWIIWDDASRLIRVASRFSADGALPRIIPITLRAVNVEMYYDFDFEVRITPGSDTGIWRVDVEASGMTVQLGRDAFGVFRGTVPVNSLTDVLPEHFSIGLNNINGPTYTMIPVNAAAGHWQVRVTAADGVSYEYFEIRLEQIDTADLSIRAISLGGVIGPFRDVNRDSEFQWSYTAPAGFDLSVITSGNLQVAPYSPLPGVVLSLYYTSAYYVIWRAEVAAWVEGNLVAIAFHYITIHSPAEDPGDAALASFYINSQPVPGFVPGGSVTDFNLVLPYNFLDDRGYGAEYFVWVEHTARQWNATSVITPDSDILDEQGRTTLEIIVTAPDGVTTRTYRVNIETYSPAPLILSQRFIRINDDNLVTTFTASGTATGELEFYRMFVGGDWGYLPDLIQFSVDGDTVTITATRPAAGEPGIYAYYYQWGYGYVYDYLLFRVEVSRPGTSRILDIFVKLTPDDERIVHPPDSLFLTPNVATINDGNLSETIAITGSVTGDISFIRGNLPAGIQLSSTGNTITVSGSRPGAGQTPINGAFIVGVNRGGITEALIIAVNLNPVPHTLSLSQNLLTISDDTLVATTVAGGTADGDFQFERNNLPSAIELSANGDTIVVMGTRPAAVQSPISGTFVVYITRDGITEPLSIAVNLTPSSHSLTLSPGIVTVNDNNMVATSIAGGTATGEITFNRGNLPAFVTLESSGNTIYVLAVTPPPGETLTSGSFNVGVIRSGVSSELVIYLDLTPVPHTFTLAPTNVIINSANLEAIVTTGGTADGEIYLELNNLPSTVNLEVSGNNIYVTATRPAANQPAVSGVFTVDVTHAGITEQLTFSVNLAPTPRADSTLEVTPTAIAINDSNLTATLTVDGTAYGEITYNRGALPYDVQFLANGDEVTIVGIRPSLGQEAIIDTFYTAIIRSEVAHELVITVNLTPAEEPPTTEPPTTPNVPSQPSPVGPPMPTPRPPAVPPTTEPPTTEVSTTTEEPTEFGPPRVPLPFVDVSEGAWYYPFVRTVWENQLFHGVTYNLFAPQGNMTRGMFVQVLANVEGVNLAPYSARTTGRFYDTLPGAWYFGAVEWAAEQNLVSGIGGGNFAPTRPITREEMAVMLNRYIESRGIAIPANEIVPFADHDDISYWALESVLAIQAAGIIVGFPNGTFAPQMTSTRAQVATVFAGFLEIYNNATSPIPTLPVLIAIANHGKSQKKPI
ncbi:MAG: S-layer homology domain-containing protein [Defluviitaleaceae bacterium]|nr:S-layer homology domain-containing protein [Defluviitaleaceae bacterium]